MTIDDEDAPPLGRGRDADALRSTRPAREGGIAGPHGPEAPGTSGGASGRLRRENQAAPPRRRAPEDEPGSSRAER